MGKETCSDRKESFHGLETLRREEVGTSNSYLEKRGGKSSPENPVRPVPQDGSLQIAKRQSLGDGAQPQQAAG